MLPETFTKVIDYLLQASKTRGEGMHNVVQLAWLDFQEMEEVLGNLDVEGWYELLNRDTMNEEYMTAINQPAESSHEHEATVPKLSEIWVSGLIRDWVDTRKRTRVRMLVHAGVRYRVNSPDAPHCPLKTHTVGFVNSMEQVRPADSGEPAKV